MHRPMRFSNPSALRPGRAGPAPLVLSIALLSFAFAGAQEPPKGPPAKAPPSPRAPSQPKVEAVPPPSEPRPGEPLVETISGTLQGSIRFPAGQGTEPPALQVGSQAIPLGEVLFVRFSPRKVSLEDAFLLLRNGDLLFATLRGGDESEIRLSAGAARSPKGNGELSIPLEVIRGIGFPRRFQDPSDGIAQIRRWFLSLPEKAAPAGPGGTKAAGAGGEDRVLLDEGAELTGILQKIDGEAVHFQSATAGDVRLPLAKVRAVLVSEEISAKGEARRDEPAGGAGITAVVGYQDGSALSGRLLAISPRSAAATPAPGGEAEGAGEIRLASKALGEVMAPLDRVLEVSIQGGRCRYLSDLKPVQVAHKKDYFHPRDVQRDLCAAGDPLALRGRTYRKGLGMLSHTRADYDLAGRAVKFQAVIGMDDHARPETVEAMRAGCGTAVFRVLVDGQVKFEKQLSWSDPPLPISIPTEGTKALGLELDYGKGFLVLGFGDWAEARVILKD